MVSKGQRTLKIVYSVTALGDLDGIWDWNAKTHGLDHAASYVEFLEQQINTLGSNSQKGHVVSNRPDLRYLLIRRRNRGHGHLAVYSVGDDAINVLHIFHTAQDWHNKLMEEQR